MIYLAINKKICISKKNLSIFLYSVLFLNNERQKDISQVVET